MQDGTLRLWARDGAHYAWPGCTAIRLADRELRWTNARGEPRSMARVFLARWQVEPEAAGAREVA